MTSGVQAVGFDGDDTLWQSETAFHVVHRRVRELLAAHVDAETLDARLLDVEAANLALYGYGAKAFTLSLVETAIDLAGDDLTIAEVRTLLDLGKELLAHPIELLPGARAAVEAAAGDGLTVLLVTKGDLFHQESKLARSGLADLFWEIEIVAEKDEATYQRILSRYDIDPATFVMVGNSVKSDILPVLALGGRAVHIEYETTWEMEHAEADKTADGYWELDAIRDLPDLLTRL